MEGKRAERSKGYSYTVSWDHHPDICKYYISFPVVIYRDKHAYKNVTYNLISHISHIESNQKQKISFLDLG